ncbi:MAG: hypothetical protein V3U78_09545 [Thiotrichaceae bacterium]
MTTTTATRQNNVINLPIKKIPSNRVNATTKKQLSKSTNTKGKRINNSPINNAPVSALRILETSDASSGILFSARTVRAGLKNNETVVLVSPEKPGQLIRRLEMIGLKVRPWIESGKLIIFNSQPAISGNLSLSTNYREVFGELFDLAGTPVDRMVIMGMDMLVNLESQYLAYASVSKFTQAADEMGCKVIAQYSRNQSEAHDRLDAACSSLVNSYFVTKRENKNKQYKLQAKNIAA